MIQKLIIKNYALIEYSEIDLSNGFIVLSGETGAGKSIILDAISLILGKRLDKGFKFTKDKKCILEAHILIQSNQESFFKSNDVDYEKSTIVRREFSSSGKTRSFINDTPVSLSILNDILSRCISVYSQNQSISIGNQETQLNLLDKLSDSNHSLVRYQDIFSKHCKLQLEIDNIKEGGNLSESELEFLKYQIDELKNSNLEDGEKEKLESDLSILENATEIRDKLSHSHELFSGENGISSIILKIESYLNGISSESKEILDLRDRILSVRIEIDDLENEVNLMQDKIEENPERLSNNIQRLDQINSLLSKHNKLEVNELLVLLKEMQLKLESFADYKNIINEKEKKLKEIENKLLEASDNLTNKRKKIIPQFGKDVESHLQKLGIKHPVFDIVIEKKEDYSINGKDSIVFMFSANKGSDPKDISKVASGGELSRLMLCFAYLVSDFDDLSCLIFDEIDSGVSGEIAHLMSEMMMKMSKGKQIISVTHLPQIASKADIHFKVYKTENNNRTISEIKELITDERIEEIAKMLSGKNITDISISNAKELLNH